MGLVMWRVLGIDATTDVSIIRKAYAAKLKTCRPDEDPEGFQSLREAYDKAISFAKSKKSTGILASEFRESMPEKDDSIIVRSAKYVKIDVKQPENDVKIDVIQPVDVILRKKEDIVLIQAPKETIDEVLRRMEELYSDFYKRIDIRNWNRILESDIFWDIEGKTHLRVVMLRFFSTHSVLPKAVWILMDREFGWSDYKDSMQSRYKDDYAVLNEEMDPRWDLDYACFNKVSSSPTIKTLIVPAGKKELPGDKDQYYTSFPDYAQLRWNLKNAVYNKLDVDISAIYETAFRLFPDDPSLHQIYYEYKKASTDIKIYGFLCDAPKYTINKLRELCPDNPEYEVAEANYYLLMKDYKKAASLYSGLVIRYPCCLDLAYHYGIAVSNLGYKNKTRTMFDNIKKAYPSIRRAEITKNGYFKDRAGVSGQLERNNIVLQWLK